MHALCVPGGRGRLQRQPARMHRTRARTGLPSGKRQSRRGGYAFRILGTFQRISRARHPVDAGQFDGSKQGWLRSLPLQRQVHGFTIVHATLDTPGQWGYVFNTLDAVASFTYQRTTVCFFGHTHVPVVFIRGQSGVRQERREHVRIEPGRKYFINAGSVGQPRDGNWRAAYCIYDIESNLVELLRVKYDLTTAQKKISKAGLPQPLAERLAIGR